MKFIRATFKAIAWIKAKGSEKTAQLLAKKMNDPNSYKINLNALKSVDVTQPRIDMPSTRIWLTAIAKQGKIPEDLVKDVDSWVMKYVDYSFLDKAQASLKTNVARPLEMTSGEIACLSGVELLSNYRRKTLSPVEAIEAVLDQINRNNGIVNAYCHIDAEGALAAARQSETRWMAASPRGLVDGIPIGIKDNILAAGMPARFGSKLTSAEPAEYDAPAVARLREHGAILIGKTAMPEFGWKAVTDSPLTGVTRNPWDTEKRLVAPPAGQRPPSYSAWDPFRLEQMAVARFASRPHSPGATASSRRVRVSGVARISAWDARPRRSIDTIGGGRGAGTNHHSRDRSPRCLQLALATPRFSTWSRQWRSRSADRILVRPRLCKTHRPRGQGSGELCGPDFRGFRRPCRRSRSRRRR